MFERKSVKTINQQRRDNDDIPFESCWSPCIRRETNPPSGSFCPLINGLYLERNATLDHAQLLKFMKSHRVFWTHFNMWQYDLHLSPYTPFRCLCSSEARATAPIVCVVFVRCRCCAQMANENNSLSKLTNMRNVFERSVARCAMARVSARIYICDNIEILCHAPKPIQLIYNSNI